MLHDNSATRKLSKTEGCEFAALKLQMFNKNSAKSALDTDAVLSRCYTKVISYISYQR